MKQKYTVLKSEDKKSIIIREFAELDKDTLSLLCEETHDVKDLKSAVSQGKEAVVSAIRTPNMYPAGTYAEKMADSIITLIGSKDQDSVEIYFDDFDLISSKRKKAAEAEEVTKDEDDEIDDLIDEDYDEDYEDQPAINKTNPSLKVDDDDTSDFDED